MARLTQLYIFATSVRPDPYVNTIMQWVSAGSIREITIVCVHEHGYPNESAQSQATTVLANVQQLLAALAAGHYPGSSAPASIASNEAQKYRDCLDKLQYVRMSGVGIRWSELGRRLQQYRGGGSAAFDVTALKKNLLVDAVTLLLSEGESNIFTFELIRPPSYDSRDLFAALSPSDFSYRRLADSDHVDTAMRRMVARSVTFRVVASVTIALVIPVVLVQIFLPNSWLQSIIVGAGAAVSLASWVFSLRQRA